MSTTSEFTIVMVVIAALLGAAFHIDRVQTWPTVTAAHANAAATTAAADPVTTGSTGH